MKVPRIPHLRRRFLLLGSVLLLVLAGCDSAQVAAPELNPPFLQAPRDAQVVSAGSPITFSWQPVDGARAYECQVSHADDEGLGVINEDTDQTTATLSFNLPGSYAWRVRAINAEGEKGYWSESWEIIVQVQTDP